MEERYHAAIARPAVDSSLPLPSLPLFGSSSLQAGHHASRRKSVVMRYTSAPNAICPPGPCVSMRAELPKEFPACCCSTRSAVATNSKRRQVRPQSSTKPVTVFLPQSHNATEVCIIRRCQHGAPTHNKRRVITEGYLAPPPLLLHPPLRPLLLTPPPLLLLPPQLLPLSLRPPSLLSP